MQETAQSAPSRPVKPIRFTVDLSHDQHRFLKTFALDTSTERAQVSGVQVMRELLEQLKADPTLAERVRAALWRNQ